MVVDSPAEPIADAAKAKGRAHVTVSAEPFDIVEGQAVVPVGARCPARRSRALGYVLSCAGAIVTLVGVLGLTGPLEPSAVGDTAGHASDGAVVADAAAPPAGAPPPPGSRTGSRCRTRASRPRRRAAT